MWSHCVEGGGDGFCNDKTVIKQLKQYHFSILLIRIPPRCENGAEAVFSAPHPCITPPSNSLQSAKRYGCTGSILGSILTIF